MSLEDLFDVTVTATSRTPTAAGFGTPLLLGYHTRWGVSPDRVRSYTSLAAMAEDDFLTTDPLYQMARAVFAQSPSPPRVKVGRRATAYTQTVNLTPSTPSASEVFTVEVDGLEASATADGTPTVAEVCTALANAINGLADADAIIATGASTAGLQTLTGASLDGVVGGAVMSPPRMLSFTFSSHADWDATTATVTGKDVDGNTITETFAIPNGGGSANGTTHFARVTSVAIPAQSGTGGTFTMGTRAPVAAVGSSGTHVACTSVAGQLHGYELATSNLALEDVTADPGLEAELNAVLAADPDWYGLALDSNSAAEVEAAADWAEANGKLFVCQSADAGCVDGDEEEDVFSALQTASLGRATGWFHPKLARPGAWVAAAVLGSRLPATPGSDTWAFKTLAGVDAYALTDSQAQALEAKNANWYQAVAGVNVTYNGKVAGGEWADVVRFLDWFRARLRERLFALQLAGPKVPFTQRGISLVRGEIAAQIKAGKTAGGFDPDVEPTINVPLIDDVPTADRQARNLPGVTFSMRLAGAIHTMEVTGTATV